MTTEAFSYEAAFTRNLGLVDEAEQARLRQATVAIVGAGGVGGSHALTLARLGVGGFRLADADTFSVANFNRQAGARVSTLGRNKAAVIKEMILDINPEARVTALEAFVTEDNVDAFLDGADVVLDGIDFFAIEARELVFRKAREKGLWMLTAGPLGFSTAFLAFSPTGMSFAEYFDLRPGMTKVQKLAAFAAAITPAGLHLPYMDLGRVDAKKQAGPSAGLACQLCSSVIALEAAAVILGRRPPEAAPAYAQFDPYRRLYKRGRLVFGNRGPIQRVKRRYLEGLFLRLSQGAQP